MNGILDGGFWMVDFGWWIGGAAAVAGCWWRVVLILDWDQSSYSERTSSVSCFCVGSFPLNSLGNFDWSS